MEADNTKAYCEEAQTGGDPLHLTNLEDYLLAGDSIDDEIAHRNGPGHGGPPSLQLNIPQSGRRKRKHVSVEAKQLIDVGIVVFEQGEMDTLVSQLSCLEL